MTICLSALPYYLANAQNQNNGPLVIPQPKPAPQAPSTPDQAPPIPDELSSLEDLDRLFIKLSRQSKPGAAGATAKRIWLHWTESGSDSINALMQWAGRAMNNKKFAAAQDLLNQVIVLVPDYAEGWNRRATLYYTMKQYGKSISDIEQVLQLEPRHFGALSGLGAILQQLEKHEQALATWYKVLEIYPANKPAINAVIRLEEKLSDRRI